MSDNTEEQMTRNVLNSIENTANPRLKAVMTSLIHHLHAFIREVELTEEEWMSGIQFLTRTGQMCDEKRQEFILLSDTMGVTMLVDAINHRLQAGRPRVPSLARSIGKGRQSCQWAQILAKMVAESRQ